MLLSISIKNFLLINDLYLKFDQDFTVITGDSGSGKSFIFDAISIALGIKKSDDSLITKGKSEAYIILEFDISNNTQIKQLLSQLNLPFDDNILIIRKVLRNDGKNKVYVNDIYTSINAILQLSSLLIEIHGQHAHVKLLSRNKQRELLDLFAGNEELLNKVSIIFLEMQEFKKRLVILEAEYLKFEAEQDYYKFVLDELTELNPQYNEEEELLQRRNSLAAFVKNKKTILILKDEIENKSHVSDTINYCEKLFSKNYELEQVVNQQEIFEHLATINDSLSSIVSILDDSINSFNAESEHDLEEIDKRLIDLRDAARKYRCTINELPDYMNVIQTKLMNFENNAEEINKISFLIKSLEEQYIVAAKELSSRRIEFAEKFERLVHYNLTDLKMGKVLFKIDIADKEPSSNGSDYIEFQISTNPASQPKNIIEVVSGGELSRIMLACLLVQNTNDNATILFDEIDSGISGATAHAVGKKLKELSRNNQILAITHQPQVSAIANHHIVVEKIFNGNDVFSNIRYLSREEKSIEIARLISGDQITDQALNAANTLIEEMSGK